MSYVDLHCHLLPNIDDGAYDQAASLEYARKAAATGTQAIVCTPHIKASFPEVDIDSLPERVADLQRAIDQQGIPLTVYCGGELDWRKITQLNQDQLMNIAQGTGAGKWILLESPLDGICDDFLDGVEDLRERGLGIMLAHPERTPDFLTHGYDRLRAQWDAGLHFQINVDSLAGYQGSSVQQVADTLVDMKVVSILATDSHPGTRDNAMHDGFNHLRRLGLSRMDAWEMTERNPRLVLHAGLSALHKPARRYDHDQIASGDPRQQK